MISGSVQVAAGHWYPRPGSYVNVSRKSLICDLVNWGGCCLIQIWSEAQHPTDQMIVEGEQMMINCFTDQMILGGGRIGQNCLSVVTGKGALHGSTVIRCFRDERCHPALIENSGSAPPDVRSFKLWTKLWSILLLMRVQWTLSAILCVSANHTWIPPYCWCECLE